MSALILDKVPESGKYSEYHFGDNFQSKLWIEFEDNNYQKWIGCFATRYSNMLNKVLINHKNNSAFIISGGIGYLIDTNKRELLYQTSEIDLIQSGISTRNPNYYIIGTYLNVMVFDTYSLKAKIEPDFMVDGIYFESQIDKKAIGKVMTAENQYDKKSEIEFDLITFNCILKKESLIFNLLSKFKFGQ